jgi:hypothetical protein
MHHYDCFAVSTAIGTTDLNANDLIETRHMNSVSDQGQEEQVKTEAIDMGRQQ